MGKIETAFRAQTFQRSTVERYERHAAGGTMPLARPWSAVLNAHTLPTIAAGVEFFLIAAACYKAGSLYHHFMFGHLPFATFYLLATFCLAALFVTPCGFARDYSIKRLLDLKAQLRSVFVHWNTAYALFVLALFMSYATDFYSRGSIIVQYAAGLSTALLVRLLIARFVARGLERGNLRGNKVVVVGEIPLANETIRRLRVDGYGSDLAGVVTLDAPSLAVSGRPLTRDPLDVAEETRNALRTVETLARQETIDDIVINLPWSENERIQAFIDGLSAVPATLHIAPDSTWTWTRDPVLARVGGMHTIRLARAPLTRKDQIIKRIFDVVVASLLLIVAAPMLGIIALLIKLGSKGPVLFRQRRHGFNQHEFRVFKFRTMNTLDDGDVIRQATRGDGRVTGIGRILRATNFDELPQLFNVIKGEMSLVGPRPHAVAHNNSYEERIRLYARRHNVKPGITGWAQVRGYRGETNSIQKMRDRVEHDHFYIDHWSLLFDIKIMIMTVFSPRSYRNAY
jgi:Undecaprenyl-phosphate glucose phosphotransferase